MYTYLHPQVQHTQLTLTFGSSLQMNKQEVFVCPAQVNTGLSLVHCP